MKGLAVQFVSMRTRGTEKPRLAEYVIFWDVHVYLKIRTHFKTGLF